MVVGLKLFLKDFLRGLHWDLLHFHLPDSGSLMVRESQIGLMKFYLLFTQDRRVSSYLCQTHRLL